MRRLLWLALFITLFVCFSKDGQAQNPVQFTPVTVDPTGQTCNATRAAEKTPDGILYTCQHGHMAAVGSGGGGSCGALVGNVTGTCGATVVVSIRKGLISALPATCTVGDIYFASDAAAGANIYQCTATNVWSPPAGASSGTTYTQSFSSQMSVVLTHNLGTVAVEVQCFDGGSPAQRIETNTEQATTINSYTVTFQSSQSGSCVVLSGAGEAGPIGAAGPPGGGVPGSQPNQPLTGLGIEYISGLTFAVGAGTYQIGGTQYSSPLTNPPLTLTAADMTNPRIDVIYVDNTGVANFLTGTPAMNPAQPTVDYSTQLPLNIISVPAGATTPGGVATTTIYDENTEWTCTASAHFNCASTNNPYRGTKDIEATAAVLGNTFTLVKPASGTTDLSTLNNIVFYIRSKAQWPTGSGTGANGLRTLSVYWLNGSTQVGLQVVIKDNAFNFQSNITTGYQQIVIPASLFGTGSNLVTSFVGKITGNGGTSSIGFYYDANSLQSGTGTLTLPVTLMNFKGTWNSTTNYNVNDTVVSAGIGYVALAANTNIAVTTTATWATVGKGAVACSQLPPLTGDTTSSSGSCGTTTSKINGTAFAGTNGHVVSFGAANIPADSGIVASGITQTICSGTIALQTSAISSASHAETTATCTGAASTDTIQATFNGSPLAVTGFVPATAGMLGLIVWPTTNTINVSQVNNTVSSITPGAITLNYRVVR